MDRPKIIIDVHGADNSPYALVDGAIRSLSQDGFDIVFIGQEQVINKELLKYTYDNNRISLVHAPDVVNTTDKPTEVIRFKKESSMIMGLNMLKTQDDCIAMISAGNTGTYLTGGVLIVGRLTGVLRPSLAAFVPTVGGNKLCICDAGANVDSKPEYINQYALLASCYMRAFRDIQNPKVGLLNNGIEDNKGTVVIKETYNLLKANKYINFVGNVEARYALEDIADIVVADGMMGNILLKSIEGTAITVFKMLKNEILSGGIGSKLGAALLKKTFGNIRYKMDYQQVGGAPLLGLNKIVLKAHGSSEATSIKQSVWDIYKMHNKKMIENIKESILNANK